jgi:hypothetical protein
MPYHIFRLEKVARDNDEVEHHLYAGSFWAVDEYFTLEEIRCSCSNLWTLNI